MFDNSPYFDKMHSSIVESVSDKINFSFKEGKFKVKATQFSYIVGVINAPLETLKGVGSAKWKRRIYIDFDEKFTALMASLQKAAGSKDNW